MFGFKNPMKVCKHCSRKLVQKFFWICGVCDVPERKPSIQVPLEPSEEGRDREPTQDDS